MLQRMGRVFSSKTTKEKKVNLHIQVVRKYVNLRGFVHAASWMENLSTSTNKNLQIKKFKEMINYKQRLKNNETIYHINVMLLNLQ